MKILAIGDFHGKFPGKLVKTARRKDISLILCIGDLGGSKKLLKIIFKYFKKKWWDIVGEEKAERLVLQDYKSGKKIIDKLDSIGKTIYIIPGNWDFGNRERWERTAGLKLENYPKLISKKKNLVFFNRTLKEINGFNILFFGGMVTAGTYILKGIFKEKEREKFIKKNNKEIIQLMGYSRKNIDILLAHYPPYGFFDKVKYKGENPMKNKHVGFRGYTKFIRKNQPALFICGHMHEYQGKAKLGKTTIVSIGPASEGKAAIIELDEKRKRVKKVKFLG